MRGRLASRRLLSRRHELHIYGVQISCIVSDHITLLLQSIFVKQGVITSHLLKYHANTLSSQFLSELLHVITFKRFALSND